MNKWRLLLFAVFCIFQPISTENLFNGRERCLLQRPDFYRKDSRLLEDQSNASPEIRQDRTRREFSERVNGEHILRFTERNDRDEVIRSEDLRSGYNDRIRVSLTSRQRTADNANEGRSDRSSRSEITDPEIRNVREERRSNAERETRTDRLIRNPLHEIRRGNDREDTRVRRTRNSQFVYAPNRRIVGRHFDDIQDRLIRSRQERDLNERRESRRSSRDSQDQENARANSKIVYDRFITRDDASRRSNERLQREFRLNSYENRRQSERYESVIRAALNTEIGRQRAPATNRRINEQRDSVLIRESDESRAFRRELRESSDKANERIVRLESRRQTERITRAQRNVPESRRNNNRLEITRSNEEISRRSSLTTIKRVFERKESPERREIDEAQLIRRELKVSQDRDYERENVQRRQLDESRDFRRELRNSADRANNRYIRSEDSFKQTNERFYSQAQRNIRPEFIRTYNAENSRRSFLRDNIERSNEDVEHRNLRRETRISDRTDSRLSSQTQQTVRQDARKNFRMDFTRNHNEMRLSTPVSIRDVDIRVEYLQNRDSDTSRHLRRETRALRYENVRAADSNRKISERRKSVDRSDTTTRLSRDIRQSQGEIRRNSDIRREDLAQRMNERVQSQNPRERQSIRNKFARNSYDENERDFSNIVRNVGEKRASRQRDNLGEPRNLRREIRAVWLDKSIRRNVERLNAKVQRDVLQRRTSDSNIRALNVEQRQDRRVDENERTARDMLREIKVTDKNDALRHRTRDNERIKELLERTVSMTIRKQLDRKNQRDDTSRRTTIYDSNERRDMFNQKIRISAKNNRDNERHVERRVNRETPENYRYESQSRKNVFERNMERDSSQRLDIDSRREREIHRNALFLRDNVKDNKNVREEIRLSMAPNNVSSDEASDSGFKWQHLLYLLQAAYIVSLLTKIPKTKENFKKKTRIGIWNHAPKLIKVD